MERKDALVGLLGRGYEMEMAFAAGLSDGERASVGSWDDWAIKDTVAHTAAWRDDLATALAVAREGGVPSHEDDFERKNALIYEEHHGKSWEEVRAMAGAAHQALLHEVSRLDETTLDSTSVLPWQRARPLWRLAVGTGFSHPLIHVSDHLKKRGEIQQAADLVAELATSTAGLDDSPHWQGVVSYNLACHQALLGRTQEAVSRLAKALDLNPGLLDWSKQDPDLQSVRSESACQAVFRAHEHG